MSDATTLKSELAWFEIATPPRMHSSAISYMVWRKWKNDLSKKNNWTNWHNTCTAIICRRKLSSMGLIRPMSLTPSSWSSTKPSSSKSKPLGICLGLNPYHVPQYSMISSYVTSMTMKVITIWACACNVMQLQLSISKLANSFNTLENLLFWGKTNA